MNPRVLTVAVIAAASVPALGACSDDTSSSADATTIAVSSTDDACQLSTTSAPAGPVTFQVKNDGGQVTEFYLYGSDGQTIIGEVENIGPGITRELRADVDAGSYVTACKPGQSGDGIRGDFSVS
jgi:iron uptake system component EfeO